MKKKNARSAMKPVPARAAPRRGSDRSPAPATPAVRRPSFPIVGLGASAGGLEALELFFRHVPKGSGLAYVVVQHLDPTRDDLLVELLQRGTTLPVIQIKDRMTIAPNRIYVIPPNRDLSLLHGVLHLLEPVTPRGLRLPIDHFFRALAEDMQDRSIGVILSGMGSDGTLGLRAIKEKAGVAFVQAPASAKFTGMPVSAIEAGLADVVAPVEELPGRIVAYLSRIVPHRARSDQPLAELEQSALEKIIILLRTQTGHDFSLYKKSTLYRRIERRMGLHDLHKIADYVRYLRANAQESELLFKELLIGVTSFFRDPAVWEQLRTEALPALLAARPAGGTLRVWVPACSTGEEAYSLAIVFKEALEQLKPARNFSLQIFATDLDKDAIEKARAAVYPANIAADVSATRLKRFFVQEDERYRVSKEIRELVIFAPQNVVMDPPFTKLDVLTCRNLLIYLDQALQRKLMPLFHYSLNPGGILLLGSAETVGKATDLFPSLPGKTRLYRRSERTTGTELMDLPAVFGRPRPSEDETGAATVPGKARPAAPNLQTLANQLLLQQFSPAAVLVTDKGDIVYINGKTGKYLEPAAGKTNWNLFAMAREGLNRGLMEAFRKALSSQARVVLPGVRVGTNGGTQIVDIAIQPVIDPEPLRGMVLVVFTDVASGDRAIRPADRPARSSRAGARLAAVEQELQQAREEVQTVHEEMQTSQEELKSTNEELQSTNEELQSTNEELTTSKEEMQSMNEELQTVNQELQAKVDELSRASNDMKNLLNSTDIATVFLDAELRLRRFTTLTAKIIRLLPGDLGRPITHITTDLEYPALVADVQEVLQTLVFKETSVTARDGRWFTVRIMPYRTQDNRIDGVVITFFDISVAKKLEAELRATEARLRELLNAEQDKGGKP
jgi:two-component system CheB/CheR fusion protein